MCIPCSTDVNVDILLRLTSDSCLNRAFKTFTHTQTAQAESQSCSAEPGLDIMKEPGTRYHLKKEVSVEVPQKAEQARWLPWTHTSEYARTRVKRSNKEEGSESSELDCAGNLSQIKPHSCM